MPVTQTRRGLRSNVAGGSSAAGTSQQSQNLPSTSAAARSSQRDQQRSKQNDAGHDPVSSDSSESSNGEVEGYGDMHRLVLQGIMAAGYLDVRGVKRLFQEACKQLKCQVPAAEHVSPPFIQRIVREINERIKDYDMVIRSATCEVTGEKFYVFLITIEKQVMRHQTYFPKLELQLFQKILDSILHKPNFSISETECINIGGDIDPRSFSKSNAEDFVQKMVGLQFFTKVYNNKDNEEDYEITLGFRTIREFEPIFRELYDDVFANCCLCKMLLLNGYQCPNCPAVLHKACLKKYIKNCKTCVSCSGPWRSEASLLIRTQNVDGEEEESSQSQKSTGKAKKANRDIVEMPTLEPMVSTRSTSQSQKKQGSTQKEKEKSNASTMKKGEASAHSSTSTKKKAATPSGRRTRSVNIVSSSDSE